MGTSVYNPPAMLLVATLLLLVLAPYPANGFFGRLVDKVEAILDGVDGPIAGKGTRNSNSSSEATEANGGNADGGKYQVFRAVPKNGDELRMLNALYHKSSELQLNFWKSPTVVGRFADVMVSPESINATLEYLEQHGIDYKVIIDDVQRLILQREKPAPVWASQRNSSASSLLSSFFGKRMRDDSTGTRNRAVYGFGEYHSYNEIVRWMEEIERNYPQMARTFSMGSTYEGRQIKGIKIGYPIGDSNKRAVWIDGGMHAREWASIHTALYFIDQLIGLYDVDPQIAGYVQTLNFYITPVANPDGFEYSRSDVDPQTRFWRKNRGGQVCRKDRWRRDKCCGGVDLNRNFDFHWGEVGSSNDLCSDIFQGTSAFSEPEARAIRDKILSPELNGKLDAFITLHTYAQMWIHPWNHERRTFPDDVGDLQSVGRQGVAALEAVYGTRYKFGTGADILYPSSGGSDDWAKAHAHVKYVYLLELRPGEQDWDGFLLDKRQLIPTGRETWEGVKKVVDAVVRAAPKPNSPVAVSATFTAPQPAEQQPRLISSNPIQISSRRLVASQQDNRDTADGQSAQFLRDSLHERLARLRTQQQLAWQQYEQQRQAAEQQRQAAFWQNPRNQLQSQCSDRSPWCSRWIAISPNICQSSTVYMTSECRLTCGLCSR